MNFNPTIMRAIYIALVLCAATSLRAQDMDVPFEKEYFKDRKSEFKEAKKQLEEGNAYYTGEASKYGLKEYSKALKLYEQAYQFNPNSSALNLKIGICYMKSIHKYKALDYFLKAYKLKNTVDKKIHYHLGTGYHIQYKFDKAIQEFEYFRKTLNQKDHIREIFMVNKKIEECKTGKELYNNPVRVWIDNMGPMVNSKYADYSPMIATDESAIFFTSRREDTYGGNVAMDDGKYFEDIYKAEWIDGEWQQSVNMGSPLNSKSHDATSGLSPDGNTLFVFDGAEGNGDILVAKFRDGEWSKPKSLGKNINDKNAKESSACLSFDGKTLFFVSGREGGLGEKDIYTSTWDEGKERWGPAENLGPVINTKYDEAGVFIHPDGKTMYFASKGHATMGGYDIFSSVFENGVWSTPENIGYPVNTPDDDVHFVISANGRTGYFSSFHEEGVGEKDIYKVTFLGPEKLPLMNNEDNLLASVSAPLKEKVIIPKVEVKRSDVAILKGIVRDAVTKEPIDAYIEIVDNETHEIISEIISDSKSGKYLVSLPSGKNYGMAVKAEGYLFHSENFLIPVASGYREYRKDIDMKKVEVGSVIVLRNIFFDLEKATLRPESKAELERLIKLLTDNPTIKIEISGHTDTRGNDSYNQKLSEDRSESVVNYLIDHGIVKDRLEFKGYGETQLMVSDEEIYKLPKSKREDLQRTTIYE